MAKIILMTLALPNIFWPKINWFNEINELVAGGLLMHFLQSAFRLIESWYF